MNVMLSPAVPGHSVGIQDSLEVVVDPSAAVEEISPVGTEAEGQSKSIEDIDTADFLATPE